MATRAGGVRVSAKEVKWSDGSFVIAATSASEAAHPHTGAAPNDPPCLPNDFCGYSGTSLGGNEFAVSGTGWIPYGECSPTKYP
jgi:hypothetical protein